MEAVVGDDDAGGELVAGGLDALGQQLAGLVVFERAGVGYGEDCDAEGHAGLRWMVVSSS